MSEHLTVSEFVTEKVLPYRDHDWIYLHEKGYILWRPGTGMNVELLHIRSFHKGQGLGKELFKLMLHKLRIKPPYHSVYGFTRTTNDEAQAFYGALGFTLVEVPLVYADGRAILFSAPYEELLNKHCPS